MTWLVKHREGTCALKHQNRKQPPPESVTSVPTLCGHFVMLPHGFDRGAPTCTDCLAKIGERRAES